MEAAEKACIGKRLSQLPILHVRGDHYTIGYTIGRQFVGLIQDCLSKSKYLHSHLLPAYHTEEGGALYARKLALCTKKFPGYVDELRGMADGANVPQHYIFLHNFEVFLTSPTREIEKSDQEGGGCTSIISNAQEMSIGHTEDAEPQLLNNVFVVSAEVLGGGGEGVVLEKFTTLTYAGCLPGYTMGFNEHGFIHTINTLYPRRTPQENTPRYFIARALLGARDLGEVLQIVKDKGTGIADGFGINACFLGATPAQHPLMYNIEIGPPSAAAGDEQHHTATPLESLVDVLEIKRGETYAHCNKYLRLSIDELEKAAQSSLSRHRTIERHPKPERLGIIRDILSDRTDPKYSIFRNGDKLPDYIVTLAVGVFDISARKWSIYSSEPNKSNPIAVLDLPTFTQS